MRAGRVWAPGARKTGNTRGGLASLELRILGQSVAFAIRLLWFGEDEVSLRTLQSCVGSGDVRSRRGVTVERSEVSAEKQAATSKMASVFLVSDSPLRRPRSQEPFAGPARGTRPTLRPARAANGEAANGATSLPRATGGNSVCASPGRLRQTWRWGQRVAGPGEMAPTRRSASISPRARQARAQPIGSETWRGAFSPWLSAALCCR
ncbi:uncharacterized protein LOC110284109 [Mus caroli]|uniref:Uncharacterized protein LOC110284109 n=1 Tax=Mus caroli TaxID=10089 RepID=A0A6P5NWX3_MUSCR|nr:uncharacterized protein LOC110284109 [Mus caroli]